MLRGRLVPSSPFAGTSSIIPRQGSHTTTVVTPVLSFSHSRQSSRKILPDSFASSDTVDLPSVCAFHYIVLLNPSFVTFLSTNFQQ